MKPALSTCGKKIDESLFAALREADIGAVEISLGKKEIDALNYEEILSLSKRYGIELWSFHLPFMPFSEIDISRASLAENTVSYIKGLIDKASAIGIKMFVIHPSGEPIEDGDRQARMECAKRSLRTLAEYAAKKQCTLAVEDLPRSCLGRDSAELSELLSAHDALRVCFDTNHLLSEDIGHFIRTVGDKIVTTHFSDYDGIDERHWMPFEGRIDWGMLMRTLREVGYDGYVLYELGFATPKTITRERELTVRDFAENFEKLQRKAAFS